LIRWSASGIQDDKYTCRGNADGTHPNKTPFEIEEFDAEDISEKSVGIPDSSNIGDTEKYLSLEM